MRTTEPRAAAALIGAGLYVVGGWLLLSRLFSVGIGPIDQSASEGSPAFTSVYDPDVPLFDRRATELNLVIVSLVDGPTYNCLASDLVAADEIMVRSSSDLVAIAGLHDCVPSVLPPRETT